MQSPLIPLLARLGRIGTEVLEHHLGMMGPMLIDEIELSVKAEPLASEQHLVGLFLFHVKNALPSDMDREAIADEIQRLYHKK